MRFNTTKKERRTEERFDATTGHVDVSLISSLPVSKDGQPQLRPLPSSLSGEKSRRHSLAGGLLMGEAHEPVMLAEIVELFAPIPPECCLMRRSAWRDTRRRFSSGIRVCE